jgi:DNA mismatch repair protein MutL
MASRRWLGPSGGGAGDAPWPGAVGGGGGDGVRPLRPPSESRSPDAADGARSDWLFAGATAPAAGEGDAASDPEAVATADRVADAWDAGAGRPGPREEGRAPVPAFGALPLLGQLRASYLLVETRDGLLVVDQHAAHERILYEGLRSAWLAAGVARQGLLTPVTVQLTPAAAAALQDAAELALRLGFEIEPFGDASVLVRALPAELAGEDVAGLVGDLAAAVEALPPDLETDASAIRWLPSLDRLFATLACHAARRFGDRLPAAEQRAILQGLDTIPWAPTCPHGRPVAVLIRHEDLETRFRRR